MRKFSIFNFQFSIFLLAFVVMLSISCTPKSNEQYESVKVERGNINSVISATGVVEPRNRLAIKPPVGGRIESVLVDEGQRVRKGQILAWMSSSERATLLDAARANGEDELKYWEAVYRPTPISAPLDGFIIKRDAEPGQSITVTDAPLVMADRLMVKAQVDETDIGKIKLGQSAVVVLDSYPETRVSAEVEQIAYESTLVNNVNFYEIKVVPKKVPTFFRSGMSATVNFELDKKNGILLLPVKAVRKRNGSTYVFVQKDENSPPTISEISTGIESQDTVEIISGLKEGDPVVIPTASLLRNSSQGSRRMPINPFSKQK